MCKYAWLTFWSSCLTFFQLLSVSAVLFSTWYSLLGVLITSLNFIIFGNAQTHFTIVIFFFPSAGLLHNAGA